MTDNLSILHNDTVWGILFRFAINVVFQIILVGFLYFRYSKKEKFLFTFFIIGIIVFFVSSIMKRVDIGLGLAFGLFAIFGILRLRTRNFSIKDMAYLFSAIGLSVINSLGLMVLELTGVLIINIIILLFVFVLEKFLEANSFSKHSIIYENLSFLKPDNQKKLLDDISNRSGRNIIKITVQKIDYEKKIAELEIFFKE
jgi:hypothetical protein